jgi:hypothetical protein
MKLTQAIKDELHGVVRILREFLCILVLPVPILHVDRDAIE